MPGASPSIAVLGAGGVGGFVAAALARAHQRVTVIAREQTASLLQRDGLEVDSDVLGKFSARLRVASALQEATDVLLIATKATGLGGALERIETAPALVVPLLNGVEHMTVLRERFDPDSVVAGVIRIESDRPATGRILQSGAQLRIDLADEPSGPRRRPMSLEALRDSLLAAELPTRLEGSEAQVLWSKLVRLNSLSATTTASDRPLGFVRTDPEWRGKLVSCVEETAAVAAAEGAHIDPAATIEELEAAHAELGSSMQRDVRAGRTPELDAIQGAVIRRAHRHGLEVPTVRALASQIAARAGVPAPESA